MSESMGESRHPEQGSSPGPPPGYGSPPPPPPSAPPAPPPPPPPPPPYGSPPPPNYGSPPPPSYGQAAGGGYAGAAPYAGQLAEWPKRAGAYAIDAVIPSVAVYIVAIILGVIVDFLGILVLVLGLLGAFAFALYNAYLAGQTGQSLGMKQLGIRLVDERSGQPVGGGLGIARYFVHVVDSVPCIPVGFLWPLWDDKKQTFSDKIFSHVVLDDAKR